MNKDDLVKTSFLQAAEKLFQRWGINKTTMEDIAREAGKGKSTLYYYFKSKEEVLEAVALAQLARISEKILTEIEKRNAARDKLMAYVFSMFKSVREAVTLYDIARGEIRADKDLIGGVLRRFNAEHERIVESILRSGIDRGELKITPRDVKAATKAIITVMRSLTINLFIENDDKETIDNIIRLLSEGL